jgi:hypothetical protein
MLHNFTIVPLSNEQAMVLRAETNHVESALDGGSMQSTLCRHPELGDLIVIENTAGSSAVVLDKAFVGKLSTRLSPSATH